MIKTRFQKVFSPLSLRFNRIHRYAEFFRNVFIF